MGMAPKCRVGNTSSASSVVHSTVVVTATPVEPSEQKVAEVVQPRSTTKF